MQLVTELYLVIVSPTKRLWGGNKGLLTSREEAEAEFLNQIRRIDTPIRYLWFSSAPLLNAVVLLRKYSPQQKDWFDEAKAEMVKPGVWIADEEGTRILKEYKSESTTA